MTYRVDILGVPRKSIARAAGVLLAFALVFAASGAKALTSSDIMGRWCGDTTAYNFTPAQLTVTFFDGHPQRVLRIKSIEILQGNLMNVIWDPRDGGNTVFQEFTGRSMVQAPNTGGDMGPRREFHRC
jgi:hypothetical protein